MFCTAQEISRARRGRGQDLRPRERRARRRGLETDWDRSAPRNARFRPEPAPPSICQLQPFIITRMQAHDRLIVAADLSSAGDIIQLAEELRGIAGVLKIGLQAFVANGPALVREISSSGI